jgi:hypothetical protein
MQHMIVLDIEESVFVRSFSFRWTVRRLIVGYAFEWSSHGVLYVAL